jgi:hypothetical protein
MADLSTQPRQVRLLKCAIMSPGLEKRAGSGADAATLRTYGFDLTAYVQKIDIYENIFDNTISGSVTLLENIGLIEYIPIVGVESVMVAFSVENSSGEAKTFTRAFRVSKVSDIAYPRHDYRLYTLKLVTHEYVMSLSSRICRAFTNTTTRDAVREVLVKDLRIDPAQLITNEPTYDKVNIVIPNYTPLQTINYFTVLSQTSDNKESNFLFFETLDGFHFTSVSRLIRNGLAQRDFRTFEVNPGQVTGPFVNDETARNAIKRVHQDQTFDLLTDITGGTLRAKMVYFDVLARKIEHNEDSRYSETFKKTTHLDKYPVYPENYDLSVSKDVRLFTVPSNAFSAQSKYSKSKGENAVEQRLRESIVLRNRQLREIRHVQSLIDLPGQPDLRAGDVVNVLYPSSRALEGQNVNINTPVFTQGTPFFSGKHLVTAVHHILASKGGDQMEYRMNIRVCKDSFGAPLIGTSNEDGK